MTWSTLESVEDASVNHVLPTGDGGFLESRFVQRTADYFICYLSSHSGCAHSCRFCHLTATKQTMMTPVSLDDYLAQAQQVLATYDQRVAEGMAPVRRMHFNFMSRGEALSNPQFVKCSTLLFNGLESLARKRDLASRFLVSTIMPQDFEGKLERVFQHHNSVPYYSLYSVDPQFRKRWLPKAMDPQKALDLLAAFQRLDDRKVVLHWAFIEGENDTEASVDAVLDAVERSGLRAKFNLVRYNPHDARHGRESSEAQLQFLFNRIATRLGEPGSRIVPRVGHDVKASCGMFIAGPRAQAQELAIQFHDAYEELAPSFGYETRLETRQFDPTTPNGRLMIAVCQRLIDQGIVKV